MDIETNTGPRPIDGDTVMQMRNGLLIVDNSTFMRDCVARWLSSEMPDLRITVISDSGQWDPQPGAALPALALLLLASGSSQSANWLHDQVEILRARDESVPVAVLADDGSTSHAEALVEALSLQGHISMSSSARVVHAALRLVLAGGAYHPRSVRRVTMPLEEALRHSPAELTLSGPTPPALTPREERVLSLVAKGLPNKVIAYRLGMSVSTVKVHVHHLIQKLRAQNRTELAILAPTFGASRPTMRAPL